MNPATGASAVLRVGEDGEGLAACVHCGLCLPACPTFEVLREENDSPRGRIYLMRLLVEGRIPRLERSPGTSTGAWAAGRAKRCVRPASASARFSSVPGRIGGVGPGRIRSPG